MINTTEINLNKYNVGRLHYHLDCIGRYVEQSHVLALTTENKEHFRKYEYYREKYRLVLDHILKRCA